MKQFGGFIWRGAAAVTLSVVAVCLFLSASARAQTAPTITRQPVSQMTITDSQAAGATRFYQAVSP